MDAERIEIVEMTPAESAWHEWAMSQDIDTGGKCVCGHEGLGIDWHAFDCRGANHALRQKVLEMFGRIAELKGELAAAESTIAALEAPETRAALTTPTAGDYGPVPYPRPPSWWQQFWTALAGRWPLG